MRLYEHRTAIGPARRPPRREDATLGTPLTAPRLGLANSHFSQRFVKDYPGIIDYVEVPFEQLVMQPTTPEFYVGTPLILHCASLGVSAEEPPTGEIVAAVREWAAKIATPWIGEHLAFVQAPSISLDPLARETCEDIFHPYSVGYTVSPQMTPETLDDTVRRLSDLQTHFDVPLIVENPPIYFDPPGSTIHQFDFIREIAEQTGVGLLLDLAHFVATCKNQDLEVSSELRRYPLNQVVEIHLSGVSKQEGMYWDDHAIAASPEQLEIVADLLSMSRPQALTLEYNWHDTFPASVILAQVDAIRSFS
jgi:uncharacterized protein (UPF0276 family)